VNQLLGGSFFPDDRITVIHESGRGLDRVEVLQPKIIVGISLTPPSVINFTASSLVFPAILDTGCNTGFEIDENHLELWTGTHRRRFDRIGRYSPPGRRSFVTRSANIWIHLEPYTGPRFVGPRMPFHLVTTDEITVMDRSGTEPYPRFPLLGLQALVDNRLQAMVDGFLSRFDIYEA
jgi:hypothetical protein